MKRKYSVIPYSRFLLCFIFIVCSLTHSQAQIIVTVAGNGTTGYSGDGGPAAAAQFNFPNYVTFDGVGNMYIADDYNNCIRKVNHLTGIITTVAGNDTAGYSGDGGPATLAKINQPSALAVDISGNLYIADNANHVVRKVAAAGIITTIAGNGTYGYSGDGGPATLASFHNVSGVALDGSGNLYIADPFSNHIRKVNTTGIISTIAGTGTAGYTGDGGAATAAELYAPRELALDAAGSLYFTDVANNVVRKIDVGGIITTIAGTGVAGYSGDGYAATAAELNFPTCIALDGSGNIFIADYAIRNVRKINSAGIISTISGTGLPGYNGDSCAASAANLDAPWGVAADGSGNVYIAESLNNRIRKIIRGHAPAFIHGHTQSITICENSAALSMDSMLAIVDSDAHQSEIWSLQLPAAHGTVAAADTLIATGGVLFPSGLSYIPVTGYSGHDTFKVVVTDCGNAADTTAFYVTIANCTLGILSRLTNGSGVLIYPDPARNDLNLRTDASAYGTTTITNSMGQLMMRLPITAPQTTVYIKELPAGLYFIHLHGSNGSNVQKFMKQ